MDKIRNERIRGTMKVVEVSQKIQERRLQWFGHVKSREEEYVGRRVMEMKVRGRRKRGTPNQRWMDGLCKGGPEGKTTDGEPCVRTGQVEESCSKHPPNIHVGEDV